MTEPDELAAAITAHLKNALEEIEAFSEELAHPSEEAARLSRLAREGLAMTSNMLVQGGYYTKSMTRPSRAHGIIPDSSEKQHSSGRTT